jgi:hypothetical protein
MNQDYLNKMLDNPGTLRNWRVLLIRRKNLGISLEQGEFPLLLNQIATADRDNVPTYYGIPFWGQSHPDAFLERSVAHLIPEKRKLASRNPQPPMDLPVYSPDEFPFSYWDILLSPPSGPPILIALAAREDFVEMLLQIH